MRAFFFFFSFVSECNCLFGFPCALCSFVHLGRALTLWSFSPASCRFLCCCFRSIPSRYISIERYSHPFLFLLSALFFWFYPHPPFARELSDIFSSLCACMMCSVNLGCSCLSLLSPCLTRTLQLLAVTGNQEKKAATSPSQSSTRREKIPFCS